MTKYCNLIGRYSAFLLKSNKSVVPQAEMTLTRNVVVTTEKNGFPSGNVGIATISQQSSDFATML